MFRVLNITCLLAHDYELPERAGGSWRVSRINIPGGSEQRPRDWYVELRAAGRSRVLAWSEFLGGCRIHGTSSELVRDLLLKHLDALQTLVRHAPKKNARAIVDAIGRDDTMRRWFAPAVEWFDPEDPLAHAEYRKRLLDAIETDRQFLRDAREAAPAGGGDAIVLKPAKVRADRADSPLAHALARELDQALGSCRRLLSMNDRASTPAQVEGIALTVIGGVVGRVLLATARGRMPGHIIDGTARFGKERPRVNLSGHRFRVECPATLPVWDAKKQGSYTLWIELGVAPAARRERTALEGVVGELEAAMASWAGRCEQPLIREGGGWLCLVEGVTWDADAFDRWLRSSPASEKLSRATALSAPPAGSPKAAGWERLLRDVIAVAPALDVRQWQMIVQNLKKWDTAGQAAMKQALHERVDREVASPVTTPAQLQVWLDTMRAADEGDTSAAAYHRALLEKMSARATTRKSAEESRMLAASWQRFGCPPEIVCHIAGASRAAGLQDAALSAALRNALPESDERRVGSAALEQCVRALKREDAEAAGVVLFPLTQIDPSFAKWKTDDALRHQATNLVDGWAKELGQSQRHADWTRLVETRETLQRMKLCV